MYKKIQKRLRMRTALLTYYFLVLFPKLLRIKKKRYFCISMTGRSYGDNVKAIADYIKQKDSMAEIIWAFDITFDVSGIDEQTVRLFTPRYMYYLFTSRYIISNCRMFHALMPRKRKGQTYVQTWHGTALKHVEADAPNLSRKYMAEAKHDSSMIDIFISGSRFMTNIYKNSFWYDGPVYETGTPRNDLLFQNNDTQQASCRSTLGIMTNKILLYAPTFRKGGGLKVYNIDTMRLQKALEERTKEKWTIVLRLHPNIVTAENKERIREMFPNCIDASTYPDMKDLLFMTDVLISDYSSSIFDFLYTGRPCLLYAPDVDTYERGYYFSFDELPFPLATDNTELYRLVGTFDINDYTQDSKEFLKHIGSMEDGNATIRVYDVMHHYDSKYSEVR